MPTSFYTRQATNTVPVPTGDYVTVYFPIYRRLSILNIGPGVVWMTFLPNTPPPTTGSATAIAIPSDAGFDTDDRTYNPLFNGLQMTADTASTNVSITVG